jgi:hypothetical protein
MRFSVIAELSTSALSTIRKNGCPPRRRNGQRSTGLRLPWVQIGGPSPAILAAVVVRRERDAESADTSTGPVTTRPEHASGSAAAGSAVARVPVTLSSVNIADDQ